MPETEQRGRGSAQRARQAATRAGADAHPANSKRSHRPPCTPRRPSNPAEPARQAPAPGACAFLPPVEAAVSDEQRRNVDEPPPPVDATKAVCAAMPRRAGAGCKRKEADAVMQPDVGKDVQRLCEHAWRSGEGGWGWGGEWGIRLARIGSAGCYGVLEFPDRQHNGWREHLCEQRGCPYCIDCTKFAGH